MQVKWITQLVSLLTYIVISPLEFAVLLLKNWALNENLALVLLTIAHVQLIEFEITYIISNQYYIRTRYKWNAKLLEDTFLLSHLRMIYLFTKQDKLTRMKFRQNNVKDVGLRCEADMGPANQIGRTKRRLEVSLASNNNMFS